MKKQLLISLFATLSLLIGCTPTVEPVVVPQENGTYYVLNNGNWGSNDSNISVYNAENKELSADAFYGANERNLGDLGQDMTRCGEDIFIAVSNSRVIFVTDSDLKIKKEITFSTPNSEGELMQPRYFCTYEGKVYVTYYEGFVGRIDPSKNYEVDITAVGSNPEGITCCGGKAYVANSGGMSYPVYDNTVSVIDLTSFKEIKKIEVNTNPEFVCSNDGGSLVFVSSKGNYADIPAKLQAIDTASESVTDTPVQNLIWMTKGPNNRLYLLLGGYDENWNPLPGSVHTFDAASASSKTEAFVKDDTILTNAYSLSVTSDGYVFVGSSDYKTNGDVYVLNPEGKLHDKFDSMGLNPIKVIK